MSLIKKIKVRGKTWFLQGAWDFDRNYLWYLREDGKLGRVIHKIHAKDRRSLYSQLRKIGGTIVYKRGDFLILC